MFIFYAVTSSILIYSIFLLSIVAILSSFANGVYRKYATPLWYIAYSPALVFYIV